MIERTSFCFESISQIRGYIDNFEISAIERGAINGSKILEKKVENSFLKWTKSCILNKL